MKWLIAVAVALVLNLGLVFWGRGSFPAVILPIAAGLWIGLPLLVLSVLFFGLATWVENWRVKSVCAWGIGIALVILSTLLSVPVGTRVLASDLRQVRSFCETLIPALEQSKSQTGTYPRDISGVLAGLRPPHLLRPGFYQSDGTNYSFVFVDPGDMMGGFEYSSQTREWHHED